MRPTLIKVDKEGNLKITLEELQKMIDESYNSGYEDGKREGRLYGHREVVPWYQPVSVPTVNSPNWYDDRTKYEITCASSKE